MAVSTIKSSGGDYSSLSAWEAAVAADLTGSGPEEAECYDFDDTTGVVISGWTTTASDYIRVYAVSGARHNGVGRDNSGVGYRITGSGSTAALNIQEDFVRIEGIELEAGTTSESIKTNNQASGSDVRLNDLILIDKAASASNSYNVNATNTNLNISITNCIIAGKRRAAEIRGATSGTMDHCVMFTDAAGLGLVADASNTVTNTAAFGYTSACFWLGGSTVNGSNNASSDSTADDDYSASIIDLVTGDEFTNATILSSTLDFTLLDSSLNGNGTGSLTNDIAEVAYPSPSDIGCHAYVVAGGLSIPIAAYHYNQNIGSRA
jgi:hypothetical protein